MAVVTVEMAVIKVMLKFTFVDFLARLTVNVNSLTNKKPDFIFPSGERIIIQNMMPIN